MRRSTEYYNRQHGWDTTSHDYYSHLSRMERTPTVLTDVPHYPNVHMIFKMNKAYEEENLGSQQKHHEPPPPPPPQVVHKKVHFVETTEIDGNGTHEVCHEKSIDEEADGFIQQRRRNFELCQWATFKTS